MTVIFKIKRRTSGAAGSPSSLKAGELAFNEIDNILYFGFGDDGSGTATSIPAIGGAGGFVSLAGSQTITGSKTFTGSLVLGQNATLTAPALSDSSLSAINSAWVKGQNYLTGNQTITVGGDATGTGATSITLTLATVTTAATYPKITFNAKGLVTGGTGLLASDIPALTHTVITDFDTQVRTSRLDQMAPPVSSISANNQTIINVASPFYPTDAANKQYVDSSIQGLSIKPTARVATTGPLPSYTYSNGTSGFGATLTATSSGNLQVDGTAIAPNDLILVKDETSTASAYNGLYVATVAGSSVAGYVLTRHVDMDSSSELSGAFIPVGSTGTNANTLWLCNPSGTVTIGSTVLPFTRLNSPTQIVAGNGISVYGTTVSALAANSARIVVSGSGIDLASGIATTGTFKSVTVDTYGRVTSGTNPTTLSGYGITDAQSANINLASLSALSPSTSQIPYFTGSSSMSLASFTSFGQQLVAAVGATAVMTLLGLGTMALQNSSSVTITGGTIDGITLDGGTF